MIFYDNPYHSDDGSRDTGSTRRLYSSYVDSMRSIVSSSVRRTPAMLPLDGYRDAALRRILGVDGFVVCP